ncbi:acyl-CoA dehydrogenase family protein [Saccharopolyspora sp. NPDC047091]|uniref:acyl-CoA dehydrogenase family protein n=1 Tax=Saccharopolyspora sp. NPDC047091 TaxID=3155924 RepID=UPI0033CF72E5
MEHTRTAFITAAQQVGAAAAAAAPRAERDRRLDPEVVRGLVAAGFARHFVPASCGGDEGTFLELNRAVAAVGSGCTATAWCASLTSHVGRMAAHLPAAGRHELWADGPDAFLVAALTPGGRAEPVAGGYRLSGRWPFISAIDYADWALLAALVDEDGGEHPRVFAVPRAALRIEDTWHNVGMAATGSHTVVVAEALIPAARTVTRADLFAGRADSNAPCHRIPMQATTMMFATPVLGAAQGALAAWLQHVTPKIRAAAENPVVPLPGMPSFHRVGYDVELAECTARTDAAELLLERAASTADLGPEITELQTMRSWRDCAVATADLVRVVDGLFQRCGTSGQSTAHPVQRFWRDVNSVASHQGLRTEAAATAYSYRLLGI